MLQVTDETTLETSSTFAPATAARTKLERKRNRIPTPSSSNRKKKSHSDEPRASIVPSTDASDADQFLFHEPFVAHIHLPPVTIEQLLGLRGDVPDVHLWSTNELGEFFRQQGFDFVASVLHKHRLNGEDLYRLRREEVLRMRTLKLGKALKLWNVIEQIQRQHFSSSWCSCPFFYVNFFPTARVYLDWRHARAYVFSFTMRLSRRLFMLASPWVWPPPSDQTRRPFIRLLCSVHCSIIFSRSTGSQQISLG